MNDLPETGRTFPAPQLWERNFPNSVSDLIRTIEGMTQFLTEHSAGPKALYNTRLVAEELGVNIIKHGYADQKQHHIKLRVECLPDGFRLQLVDDGVPFDIRQAPEPDPEQSLEDREPGGWGISLVRHAARAIDYERRDGFNVLTVEIPCD